MANDYEKLCDDILNIDPKIRYAGMFDFDNSFGKMQKGVPCIFTSEETDQSQRQAFVRWKSRQLHADKTGEPVCAVAKYAKLFRITMPLDNNKLLLISTELDLEPFTLVEKINKIKQQFVSN